MNSCFDCATNKCTLVQISRNRLISMAENGVWLLGLDLGFGMNALVGGLVGLHVLALVCNVTPPSLRYY